MNKPSPRLRMLFLTGCPKSGRNSLADKIVDENPAKTLKFSPQSLIRELLIGSDHRLNDLLGDRMNLRERITHGKPPHPRVMSDAFDWLVAGGILAGKDTFVFAGWPEDERSQFGSIVMMDRLRERGYTVQNAFVLIDVDDSIAIERFRQDMLRKRENGERRMGLRSFKEQLRNYREMVEPALYRFGEENGLIILSGASPLEEVYSELTREVDWIVRPPIDTEGRSIRTRR